MLQMMSPIIGLAPWAVGGLALLCGLALPPASNTYAGDFTVSQDEQGATIKRDGKLVARYLINSGNKPVIYPIIGPGGLEMTRAFPIAPAKPHETTEHPHHRSFWFTHGDVNGVDFWSEGKKAGTTRHRKFLKASGGKQAVIITVNDWITPEGEILCEDQREFIISGGPSWQPDLLQVDAKIKVTATASQVKFGDTKEGSFGVRVAGTMKVTQKMGGKIINSEGQTDVAAWGQPAKWVDYHGPIKGKTVGVAILNHPSSFRYPTYWHVRTYGLFTANPFGLHHFKRSNEVDGSHSMKKGESFTLRHRVLFHRGDEKEAKIAQLFEEYAKSK